MLGVSTCLSVSICWLSESYPPKREGETSSKRKGEQARFDTGVWTWIVGWFPAQSACGFHSAWHAISPQSTSANPPSFWLSLTISLLLTQTQKRLNDKNHRAQRYEFHKSKICIFLSHAEFMLRGRRRYLLYEISVPRCIHFLSHCIDR